MIKDNINIIKDFFSLVKGKTIWVIQLFIASILGHSSSLLIPVFTSNIILYVTNGDSKLAYLNIFFLIITYFAHDLLWYWNYVAYSYNFKYCYRNLREKIIDKIFTYDNYFTTKISKATILILSIEIQQICQK